MRTRRGLPLLVLVLTGSSLAQGGPAAPGPGDLVGPWRLRGADGSGGVVRLTRGAGGLRYERSSRRELAEEPRVERGRARLDGEWLVLDAEEGDGLTTRLGPAQVQGVAVPAPSARYHLQPGGLPGLRVEGDARLRERLDPWVPAQDGNAAELLIDGEAFRSMRAAIDGAREEIELQTFQYADDETGRDFARRLMAKAHQGVRVRVLVDASSKTVNDLMKKKDITAGLDVVMRQGGVEVVHQHAYGRGLLESVKSVGRGIMDGFRRLFGHTPPPREPRGLWNHDHRKLLIVDRRVGFAGGMNVADEYEREWHDVVARVEGPAGAALHALFVDRWNVARAEVDAPVRAAEVGRAPTFDPPAGDVRAEVLGTIPEIDHSLFDLYLHQIDGAQERILIEVAYFLDDRIIAALARAVSRGVSVVVIIPSEEKNDVYLVKETFAWVQNDVVRSGVQMYSYGERLTHAKVAAWDGRTCTVGSCNLDAVALDRIAEANFVFHDARFTRVLEQRVFDVDLPRCQRIVERPLPWRRKLTSGTLHFFRSLL